MSSTIKTEVVQGVDLASLLRDERDRIEFPELYVRGKVPPDGSRFVCVEGARAATRYGEHIAMQMAYDLTEAGFTVVTTGGFGIAGAVVRGVLAGEGEPVIVSGAGADVAHPAAHSDLFANAVRAGGCIISPMANGAGPTRGSTTRTRELIASIADAVVIVEGTMRSGTADLAEQAVEHAKPLFAVPGPVTSALSGLPHQLIRDGRAALVTEADDVIPAL